MDYITHEEAMNIDNRRAAEILKPLRDMMIDQDGCPISDAYYALDKSIKVLSYDSIRENIYAHKKVESNGVTNWYVCSHCYECIDISDEFCRRCGAKFLGEN